VAKAVKHTSVKSISGVMKFETLAWVIGWSIARIFSNWRTCAAG
jgi:hypothetical protein